MYYLLFPLISLVLRELQQYSAWFLSRRFIDDSNNVEHLRKEPGGQWKQYFSQIAQSPSISHDDISVLWAFKQPQVGMEIQCVSFVHLQILMCANKWLFSFALVEFVQSLVLCVAFIYSWIQIRARARVRAVGLRLLARETWQPTVHSAASQGTLVSNDFFYCPQQISSTLTVICVCVWHNEGSDQFWKVDWLFQIKWTGQEGTACLAKGADGPRWHSFRLAWFLRLFKKRSLY